MKTNVLMHLEERINTEEKLAQDALKNNDGINSALHNAIAAELKAVKDYVEVLEDNEEVPYGEKLFDIFIISSVVYVPSTR